MRNSLWLAVCLRLLATLAFGIFLQGRETASFVWILAAGYIALECGVLSVAWKPARNLVLLGFKSDVGYSMMALVLASLAVVLAAWVQISGYFLVILAAGLLLRITLFTRRAGTVLSFIVLLISSFLGLAISWLPTVLNS
ncbi:MAG: hypothetical protein AAFY72_14845 [Cyanobacteria bacterium J06649_4]